MRINKPKDLSSEELCKLVVKGMQEKKAVDIVVMDLRDVKNAISDYFVICSGTSDTQIDAIADSVEEEVFKASKINPWHEEGKMNREWILLDYVDVVVHVFKKERRVFYDLEQLWGDAEIHLVEETFA
ncbi:MULTISPECIES: ribosome silencing factor [Larkinella]|uniref:Ribosomal silencing factor RsfS n=2 Tax=Larkinella TaxID=332157 RepID=A0A5N1JTD5_9BACT|nr:MULTISPECIES: ribosome silencing factor [Larkinella]KAA9357602.1 ribosome silencing factor [Larkinella humicola]RCR69763.1 ribosome silencing factor [Larkinella punicea]